MEGIQCFTGTLVHIFRKLSRRLLTEHDVQVQLWPQLPLQLGQEVQVL